MMKTTEQQIKPLAGPLSLMVYDNGIKTFSQLVEYVRDLKYERISDVYNIALVFEESRGTCSNKHIFLKAVAEENKIDNVNLHLVIYSMSPDNTKGIKKVFDNIPIDYIPEAHCYITIDGDPVDATYQGFDISKIKETSVFDTKLGAKECIKRKPEKHQEYLKQWILDNNLEHSFDTVWGWREDCIQALVDYNDKN